MLSREIVRTGDVASDNPLDVSARFVRLPGRTEIALPLEAVLADLDVPTQLRGDLARFAETRQHLLSYSPGYAFNQACQPHEGRGIYPQDCSIHGAVYVKGTGSASTSAHALRIIPVVPQLAEIPGFTLDRSTLFYTDPNGTHTRSRLFGAMSLEGAKLEFIIAAVKLADTIRRHGLKSIDDVFAMHVPIPIGVSFNAQLSGALHDSIDAYFKSEEGSPNRAALQSCKEYGAVAIWFPSARRVGPIKLLPDENTKLDDLAMSYFAIGRALRWEFRHGWVLSSGSGHPQNVVRIGSCDGRCVDFADQFPLHFGAACAVEDLKSQKAVPHDLRDDHAFAVNTIICDLLSNFMTAALAVSPGTSAQSRDYIVNVAMMGLANGITGRSPANDFGLKTGSVMAHLYVPNYDAERGFTSAYPAVIKGLASWVQSELLSEFEVERVSQLGRLLSKHKATRLSEHIAVSIGHYAKAGGIAIQRQFYTSKGGATGDLADAICESASGSDTSIDLFFDSSELQFARLASRFNSSAQFDAMIRNYLEKICREADQSAPYPLAAELRTRLFKGAQYDMEHLGQTRPGLFAFLSELWTGVCEQKFIESAADSALWCEIVNREAPEADYQYFPIHGLPRIDPPRRGCISVVASFVRAKQLRIADMPLTFSAELFDPTGFEEHLTAFGAELDEIETLEEQIESINARTIRILDGWPNEQTEMPVDREPWNFKSGQSLVEVLAERSTNFKSRPYTEAEMQTSCKDALDEQKNQDAMAICIPFSALCNASTLKVAAITIPDLSGIEFARHRRDLAQTLIFQWQRLRHLANAAGQDSVPAEIRNEACRIRAIFSRLGRIYFATQHTPS